MIGRTISHYKILQSLGEGGMGAVYLAQDIKLGRYVAVKFPLAEKSLDHHYHARFLREARAASALNHPNIATIYDYGETPEGQPFIVMEYVEGRGLNELIAGCALTLTRSIEIIVDVASALSAAHAHGIIHRDIKPENIRINDRAQIKVLDFGLAKQLKETTLLAADLEAKTLPNTLTQSNAFVGTPLYFSPEQASSLPADERSDLFALGVVLYECLTMRPAFPGLTIIDIASKILHVDPPPPSALNADVPEELDRITMKALAKRPADRYQTADELQAELKALLPALPDTLHGERRSTLQDKHRSTLQHEHPHISAVVTRTTKLLTRPRLSLAAGLVCLLVVALAIWGFNAYRHRPYTPQADAERWYNLGSNDLRDGTYYKASLALQQAVNIDPQFALAHARLAEAWLELDYPDKAQEELLRAGSMDQARLGDAAVLYLNAITAVVRRDFTSAVKLYQQLTQQASDEERARAFVDLGRAYEKNDDITHAIESYKEALKLDQNNSAAYLRLGILYGRKQDQQSAETAFASAEKLYETESNIEGLTEVLYQRALLLNRLGHLPDARAQLLTALERAQAMQIQPQQIRIMLQLSVVERKADNTAQAEQYAKDALALAQTIGIENLATQGLIDLGNVYFGRADYPTAERYFNQALAIAERNHGRYNEARARVSLGSLRLQQNNPADGLRFVKQALDYFQPGGYRKEISQAMQMQGRAQRMTGDYVGALATYNSLLATARQVGDKQQEAALLAAIGAVAVQQERYGEALTYFEQSSALAATLGASLDDGFNLVSRADMLWRLGKEQDALPLLEQARARAEQPTANKSLAASVHLLLAQIAASRQNYAEALKQNQSVLTFDDTPTSPMRLEAQALSGLAQIMTGAKDAGLKICTEAANQAGQASDPSLRADMLLLLATAQLAQGQNEAAAQSALRAQASFTAAGQHDSEWRAWLVAGLAAARMGATDEARARLTKARDSLQQLQTVWGADYYNSYLKRPDVQLLLKQLNQALPAAA
jgi:serine/threonine protein kinase/Flp pilus assembly protein TadD